MRRFFFAFCADRTDRHKTRKPSKKVLPTWLEHIHHPVSYIHAEERPRISRSVRRAHRTGLPADSRPAETGNILANGHSHMVPSRQRTFSIPAPYRCHALAMFVRRPKQQAPKAPTQKIAAHEKTAPSSDGAVSHTSYPRSAMIDPAAVHHTRSCAAKTIHASPHLSARHHTPGQSFPSRLQRSSIPAKDALQPRSLSLAIPSPCSCAPGSKGRPLSRRTIRPQTKRKTFRTSCRRSFRCWHLSIVPGRFQPSIVDTSELNCRVRDGNGCTLTVIDTNYLRLSTADIFPLITGRYPEN